MHTVARLDVADLGRGRPAQRCVKWANFVAPVLAHHGSTIHAQDRFQNGHNRGAANGLRGVNRDSAVHLGVNGVVLGQHVPHDNADDFTQISALEVQNDILGAWGRHAHVGGAHKDARTRNDLDAVIDASWFVVLRHGFGRSRGGT